MVIGRLDFEDVRIKSDEWPALKPKTPYLSLPLISIDGVEYAQSQAILKYIGKLTGLYPTDPKDALLVDEVAYTLIDMARGFFPVLSNKSLNDDEKSAKTLELVDRYWGGVERRLQNPAVANDGPFILGDQVSVADLGLVNSYNGFKTDLNKIVSDEVLAKYPRMAQIAEAVMNLPAVKEWYQKHPLKPQFSGR